MAGSFWSSSGSWQDSFLATYLEATASLVSVDAAGEAALKQIETRVNFQLSELARNFQKASSTIIPGDVYPNDQSEAYPIRLNELIDSGLESTSDTDWFSIFLTQGSSYKIQFYASTEKGGDLGLELAGSWASLDIYGSQAEMSTEQEACYGQMEAIYLLLQ